DESHVCLLWILEIVRSPETGLTWRAGIDAERGSDRVIVAVAQHHRQCEDERHDLLGSGIGSRPGDRYSFTVRRSFECIEDELKVFVRRRRFGEPSVDELHLPTYGGQAEDEVVGRSRRDGMLFGAATVAATGCDGCRQNKRGYPELCDLH